MVYAFIPLRSGSKSIKDKNIKTLNNKPLCYWALKSCQDSDKIDKIIVAIDSYEYKAIISNFGFNKLEIYEREKINARDCSSTESVIIEYINKTKLLSESKFLLIQATSPHLKTEEIDEMIEISEQSNSDVVSCVRLKRFIWDKNGTAINYNIQQRPRRQDFVGLLVENGAVYVSTVDKVLKSGCRVSGDIKVFEMNENSFFEIDEPKDFLISELLFKSNKNDF